MNCPECGKLIPEGKMFCPECGNAIQMVPDYDPGFEESIAVSQDVISDSISEITPDGKRRVDQNTVELPATKETANLIIKTRFVIGAIAALLALAIIIILVFFTRFKSSASFEDIFNEAEDAYSDENYELCIEDCEKILSDEKMTDRDMIIGTTLLYASALTGIADTSKALVVLNSCFEEYPESADVLKALIELYAAQGDTGNINSTIDMLKDGPLKEEFEGYKVFPPSLSAPGGEYDEEFELTLESSVPGNIYYTLDGSEATINSEPYSGAIAIKEGETTVNAIFVNAYDIVSSPVSARYTVRYDVPETPVVVPPSGSFSQPEYISLIVPEGVKAYYTEDGSDPDENSAPYEKQLTMKLGNSSYKFIFISDKGVASPVTEVEYTLNVAGSYKPEDAVNLVTASLVATGHMLDIFGTPFGSQGVDGRYVYKCEYAAREGTRTYYLVDEYIENAAGAQALSGDVYAMDSTSGMIYRAKADDEGKWNFTLLY